MVKNMLQNKRSRILILIAALLCTGAIGYKVYYSSSTPAALEILPDDVRGSMISLKSLKEEYYPIMHEMYSNTVRKNMEHPAVITFGYTIAYMRDLERKATTTKSVVYIVWDNQDQKPIGYVEVREYDPKDVGQLGCWINEKYWGKGRIVEAIKLITDVYFKAYPDEKSYIAWVRLWNQRSYKALQKAGLVDIGYAYEDGKPTRYILEMRRK